MSMLPIENALASMGLGTPVMRFGALAAGSAAIFYVVKPSIMFNADGSARPAIYFSKEKDEEATPLPWWAASLAIGAWGALFI